MLCCSLLVFHFKTLQDGPLWEGGIGAPLTTFGCSCIPKPWPCPSPSPALSQLLQHNAAPQGRCDTDMTRLAGTSSCTVPQSLLHSWNNKIYHLWQTGCLSGFRDCSSFLQHLAQAEPETSFLYITWQILVESELSISIPLYLTYVLGSALG